MFDRGRIDRRRDLHDPSALRENASRDLDDDVRCLALMLWQGLLLIVAGIEKRFGLGGNRS